MTDKNGVMISFDQLYQKIEDIKELISELKTELAVSKNKDTQVDERVRNLEQDVAALKEKLENRQYNKWFQTILLILAFASSVISPILVWIITKPN